MAHTSWMHNKQACLHARACTHPRARAYTHTHLFLIHCNKDRERASVLRYTHIDCLVNIIGLAGLIINCVSKEHIQLSNCLCTFFTFIKYFLNALAGIAQSVERLATGWTGPGIESRWGGRDFPHPARPAPPPPPASYDGYWDSLLGVKTTDAWR